MLSNNKKKFQMIVILITDSLAKEIAFLQNAEGSGLAPFDCWLCLRGIKTMALRVEKQQVKNFYNLYVAGMDPTHFVLSSLCRHVIS
jgi:O-acetylhomoserine/O-acetylserine sulfhydrylase-like pyridoxal-dependent enzyme